VKLGCCKVTPSIVVCFCVVPPAGIVVTLVTGDSVVPFVVALTVENVTFSVTFSVSPVLYVFLKVNLPELILPPLAGI